MNQAQAIGTADREVTYCGHRSWGAYRAKSGSNVSPGGVIHVREDWVTSQGEKTHAIREYRVDGADEVTIQKIVEPLVGLKCGREIVLVLTTYESMGGSTWRNVTGVKVPAPSFRRPAEPSKVA